MSGISKSTGQPPVRGDRRQVKAFLARPIEGDWPYLWIDATYLKVRRGGRIVSVAVGVNADGRREVLGMEIGISEARADLEGVPAQADAAQPARRQAHPTHGHRRRKRARL